MPALPTKQSRRLKRATVSATARSLSPSMVTSPTIAAVSLPRREVSSSLRSRDRSRIATRAPSSRKRSTIARPSPDAPPVTSATLPSSHPMVRYSAWYADLKEETQVAREQDRLIENDRAARYLETGSIVGAAY